jgi:hypothetical protein
MKKILFFFAILALSNYAFSQSKRTVNHTPSVTYGSIENVQIRTEFAGLKIPGLNSKQ